MNNRFNALKEQNLVLKDTYTPQFFRLSNNDDRQAFDTLLEIRNGLYIFDEIRDQLKELIKSRNPKVKLTSSDYERLIAEHLGNVLPEEYGVWVYYPWSGRVVHLLDEGEYIELRTSANRNKITMSERDLLATKKIGVIGLSVGQSVAVTLAMERGCGELRLADFDTLELNNLNRIRTGAHNLGLLKAYSVAREIAEIDPYFKVVCYTDGITDSNIDDFFTKGGKLDIVIDECDGINIKIQCRKKAKELSIPVLMEASDKGTLDVERFDLEPNRPIMHGWLEHLSLDMEFLKSLKTAEEKLPYMLPMLGLDTLSARLKASMVEIENTITTWPQLASAVTLGGAITADTCRRVLLNEFTSSGRYFTDLDRLIPDGRPKKAFDVTDPPPPLTAGEINDLSARALMILPKVVLTLKQDEITALVTIANTAPTAGNNQPWKWHYKGGTLFLFHDENRSFSFGDFEGIGSYAGLGAAIENLLLEANAQHLNADVISFPLKDTKKLVAAIQFSSKENKDLYRPSELIKFVKERHTNRTIAPRKPIDASVYDKLSEAVASVPGAELMIKSSSEDLKELSDIMGAADRLRLLHPDGHYEFYNKELRWNAEHSRVTADGIDIATVDITPGEEIGIKMVKDPQVAEFLTKWNAGDALKKITNKAVDGASAIGFIVMPHFSAPELLQGGRAIQRMWLTATECDIAIQPMLAAVFHFARLNHGGGTGMPARMKEDFAALYNRFEKLFPGTKDKGELFLFRMCIAEKPDVRSFRIPVENTLSFA